MPSLGALSRDEGGPRVGAGGCPCSVYPQGTTSFSSALSQELLHTTHKTGFGLGSRVDRGPEKEVCR